MPIRPEADSDRAAVRAVNERAFGRPAEANLVEALHGTGAALVSLVAEVDTRIVGHILFSPVALEQHPQRCVVGLAPMAVVPEFQRSGIGSALVRQGLAACAQMGSCAVVVLGHPDYYPRFGFMTASRYGLRCAYDVPDEVFMAVELQDHSLAGVSGLVRYEDAFAEV